MNHEFRRLILSAQAYLKGELNYFDVVIQTTKFGEAIKHADCDKRIKLLAAEWRDKAHRVSPGIHPDTFETITEEEYRAWVKVQLKVLNEEFEFENS
jgi:hypothetical protein